MFLDSAGVCSCCYFPTNAIEIFVGQRILMVHTFFIEPCGLYTHTGMAKDGIFS
jgi:hypothetical protein